MNFPMCVLKDLLGTPYYILIHLHYQEIWICMEPMRAALSDLYVDPVHVRARRRIPEEVLRELAITVSYTNFCTTFNNNISHTYILYTYIFILFSN